MRRIQLIRERREHRALMAMLRGNPFTGPLVVAAPQKTLRDEFAGIALAAELQQDKQNAYLEPETLNGLADWAYQVADAMLEARAA
jgi:hypothetical protein